MAALRLSCSTLTSVIGYSHSVSLLSTGSLELLCFSACPLPLPNGAIIFVLHASLLAVTDHIRQVAVFCLGHCFAQIFERKIRMRVILGIMITYHGYNNGHNNPMCNVHRNVRVLYTQQNTVSWSDVAVAASNERTKIPAQRRKGRGE